MRIFNWITKDTNIDFMGARKLTYALSALMMVLAVASMAFKGFNYGIDFSGGILMEISSDQVINLDELRNKLDGVDIGEINLQTIGESGKEVMIRAQASGMDEKSQMAAIKQIKEIIGSDVQYNKIELVGPQVGDELKKAGIIASVIAVLGITLYIWVRFEWQFALGAMLGLVHDLVVTVGLLSAFGMDFSLTTIAAI